MSYMTPERSRWTIKIYYNYYSLLPKKTNDQTQQELFTKGVIYFFID